MATVNIYESWLSRVPLRAFHCNWSIGCYVSFWRPHRVGIVVIPAHIGIVFGYFSVVELSYRMLSELAVVVASWGVVVGVTLLNADHFTQCGGDH